MALETGKIVVGCVDKAEILIDIHHIDSAERRLLSAKRYGFALW